MMMKLTNLRWLMATVLMAMMVSMASAQQNYGAVRGQVKDATGGTVRDAKVTLTNQDTGVSRTDVTNAVGSYLFGGTAPGTYKITIAMPGFKAFDSNGNIVTLGATATVDATLTIGSSSETVDVTADTLVLNTSNGSGGQYFSEQQLQTLPSLGRNPFLMAALDSNVVTLGDPRYVRAEDQTGGSQVSVAGAPSFSNSYVVDGIPVSTSQGGLTFIPSPEAVSESKVQSNTYDAEIGRTGGGIFATSLKSGTSQYHGVLYGETRQTNWSGNVWFNFPDKNGNKASTPNDTTYLYSGAFGGPLVPSWIKKPHWLDNTFFWVTEEGYRQGQPNTSNTTAYFVPTAAERAGDFSADTELLYDPTKRLAGGVDTCRLSKLGDCGIAGAATDPLNVLPASYINPIGSFVLGQYPAAQNTSGYGVAGNPVNYSLTNQSFKSRSDEYVGKLDHTFAPWWQASASYLHNAIQEPAPSVLAVKYANSTKLLRYTDSTVVNNSFTINPTTLLTVAYGFNRYYSAAFQYSTGFNAATDFGGTGFSAGFAGLLQSKTLPYFSVSNVTNGTSLGASNTGPTVYASNNVAAVLTKTLGRNNFKFGYALRAFAVYTNPTGPATSGGAGAFTFNGQYSNATGTSTSGNGAGAFADLLLGLPSSGSLTLNSGVFINQIKYDAVFAQDDLRVNSSLTVNIGLRYEYESGQSERTNRLNRGFDPNVVATYTGAGGGAVTTKGGLAFAGVNGGPVDCCNASRIKFAPRIGVAYQLRKDLVVHAGYGVYFSPVGITTGATSGYSQLSSYSPGNATAAAAVGTGAYLSNPFPAGVVTPTGNTLGALTGVGGSLGSTTVTSDIQDFGRRYPLVEQYSLDVEQQLPKDVIFKISYIGAHARNFANAANINQIPDAVLATYAPGGVNAGTNLATKVANPFYATTIGGLPSTGVAATATVARGQLLLPFPQFQSVIVTQSTGYSNYNSLAVKVQKQVKKGLTVLSTYTWAANWDNIWSTSSQIYNNYGPQDAYNPKGEYARSLNSIPNRFTLAVTYDLPFGKGRQFMNHPSGITGHVLEALLGGYQINDETIVQNGVPLSIVQTDLSSGTYGTTGIGGTYQRPNLIGDIHNACGSGRPQGRLGVYGTANGVSLSEAPYSNPTAFSAAAAYTYGNAPRTLPCRVPGTNASTVSINKTFTIHDRFNLQFRAEALNVFNTPQFGAPSSSLTVSQAAIGSAPTSATGTAQPYGNITSTVGFARVIQMGGRLSF